MIETGEEVTSGGLAVMDYGGSTVTPGTIGDPMNDHVNAAMMSASVALTGLIFPQLMFDLAYGITGFLAGVGVAALSLNGRRRDVWRR